MDSLCNYGSDEDQSQSNSKLSVNSATDRHIEQDVNYEPITMDMSEDSNEEEYYARKYGKYADVAAAAQAQRFDPYEDDVSDAPTSPEPDPPTGSHERDPNLTLTAQPESRDQSNGARQNHFGGNNTKIDEFGRTISSEQRGRNNERGGGGEASQPKQQQQHGYGSYYERAKRKMSGGDEDEEYGQYEDNGGSYGNNTSYPSTAASGGNSHFPPSQQQNRSKDHSHYDQDNNRRSHDRNKTSRYERQDRSSPQEKDRRSRDRGGRGSRERSRERGGRGSRDKSRERKSTDKKKRKRSRSRSRSRDRKHDRKSSRRYRSSRSHSRSSRSRSRSSSRHYSSRHSKDRRRSSDRDRRSSDRDRRHGSSSSRRDRDRRDREPSMGDLPRPYAPYERKPNKLQILEKLGIELKVSDQPTAPGQSPQVIAVSKAAPNSTSTHNIPPLMSTPINLGGLVPGGISTVGNPGGPNVTPQDLLQKTIAAQVEKIKADTGIELPKYYNPMAINPTKYAEQIQKRRLLWGNKQSSTTTSTTITTITQSQVTTSSQNTTSMPADSTAGGGGGLTVKPPGTIWQGATFSGDQDGRLTNKFQRLMGMKHAGVTVSSTTPAHDSSNDRKPAAATSSSSSSSGVRGGSGGSDLIKKQEEMFNSMESQYEAARLATHTHRGLGLGFGTFAPR